VTKRTAIIMPASAPSPAIAVAHAGGERTGRPGSCAKEGSRGSTASPPGRRPLQRWRWAAFGLCLKRLRQRSSNCGRQAWRQKIQPQRERKHSCHDETHLRRASLSRWSLGLSAQSRVGAIGAPLAISGREGPVPSAPPVSTSWNSASWTSLITWRAAPPRAASAVIGSGNGFVSPKMRRALKHIYALQYIYTNCIWYYLSFDRFERFGHLLRSR
jgi:hypothetical protein